MAPSLPPSTPPDLISPGALRRLIGRTPTPRLLDVRTPEEFDAGHVPTAFNVPLDGLNLAGLYRDGIVTPETTVYLVCRTSNRARKAAARFAAAGHAATVVVEGGTLAWVEAGFPVELGAAGDRRAGA